MVNQECHRVAKNSKSVIEQRIINYIPKMPQEARKVTRVQKIIFFLNPQNKPIKLFLYDRMFDKIYL